MNAKHVHSLPRVGLVGVSGYAGIHLNLLRDAQDDKRTEFSAAVVINPQEEREAVDDLRTRGVRLYATFDDFIAAERGRLDLCFVPTGIQWHAPMTVAALDAGMNVLVEKPLAGCLQQADLILDAERRSGKFVAVGFQDMYVEATLWLKRRLLEGAIGEVRSIRFVGLWPRPDAYYQRNRWAGKITCDDISVRDSPFNNAFAHFVHLSLFFAGRSLHSMGAARLREAELFRAHEIESFDTGVIRAVSPEGVEFWFGASHATSVDREPEIRIEGTEGHAGWFYDEHCEIVRHGGQSENRPVPKAPAARQAMIAAVLERLQDPSVFIATATDARHHTALIESAHDSTRICEVDGAQIDRVALGSNGAGGQTRAIRGLAMAVDRAFQNGSTLSSVDLNFSSLVSK